MAVYNFLSALIILILAVIFGWHAYEIKKRDRKARVEFISKFKKGSCFIIYVAAIPLFMLGMIYEGTDFFFSFFKSIKTSIDLVVLKYDISDISKLMDKSDVYTVAVYLCFAFVTINAVMFAFSVFCRRIAVWRENKEWENVTEEKLLVVGFNKQNVKIYKSEKKLPSMLIDEIGADDRKELYTSSVKCISKSASKENAEGINEIDEYCLNEIKKCLDGKVRSISVIVNTGDDKKNIALCHRINSVAGAYFDKDDIKKLAGALRGVKVYVFGSPKHETVYTTIAEESHGCIRYVNKYRMIASDFIEKYPITEFMTDKEIDYSDSVIRDGVDVNVALVGFGKTNQQIFLTSVANNQLLCKNEDGKLDLKQVHYYVFDKNNIENKKNLNHSYYRFENEFKDIIEAEKKGEFNGRIEYLPMPTLPADIEHNPKKLDVNDEEFYIYLKDKIHKENSFNYIVISFGTDLENIDMAHKIVAKKREWGLKNTYIFVKIRSGECDYDIFKNKECYMIGDEGRVVYNMDKINDDVITSMAKLRHRIYALEYELTKDDGSEPKSASEVYENAECEWYASLTEFERESNVYACLSLRSKLHMMGLDYRKKNGADSALSESDYLDAYAGESKPEYREDTVCDGKKIVNYPVDFEDTRRTNMAIQEHYRWNSFMITKGFVPASLNEIVTEKKKGKSYELRRHGNLTTFEGLKIFRDVIAESRGITKAQADVIKYDFQLLDDAYWLLSENGYEIVKKH